jgi:hypothetical protein
MSVFTAPNPEFSIVSNGCALFALAANGGTCFIDVAVTPAAAGARTGTLTVTFDVAPSVIVGLQANGVTSLTVPIRPPGMPPQADAAATLTGVAY